ncbi:MAG: PQQ-dependent sugar dehydrogenase [Candidatus Doudnabacteria bacterium]|nr:PQQ-dependent sugar dehydrogenase [Candidatus Doudnabacteria bacterium]
MAIDTQGNMWVSRTSAGVITKLEIKDGKVISKNDIIRNLKNPHGLAFDPQGSTSLYYAEENKITKIAINSDDKGQKIADLPSGGGHFTRTLRFGPDDRLYVSIGSSCNVCRESDERRAAIYSMKKDGSDFKQYAKGLRNTVFFTWSYLDGKMWGTDMGRDNLGDNTPPEEINILEEGKNYGWPNCYGKNIHDDNFDKNTYIRNPCMEPYETAPKVEMQAHSAPLGLAFIPEEGWPEEYWYDLIVAFHGSWNRSEKTGYKLVRIKLDSKGNYEGTEDFIYGWLQNGKALGRPVDVIVQPGGIIYVSDDSAGIIYKISYHGPQK